MEAGRRLGQMLGRVSIGPNVLVLALPRRGVPVGAIAGRGRRVLNDAVIGRAETERLSHHFHARIADQLTRSSILTKPPQLSLFPHAEEEQTPEVPETHPVGV
jgi:hypothetical protein